MSWGEIAQQRLQEIAGCSAGAPGVTRFPFTPEHHAALKQIRTWMECAGLSSHLDAAGTLVGRHEGTGPCVLLGSHQDSVRNAGNYDGIMGIALACLALEKLQSEHRSPRYPVEVLAFADEEGVRFPTALLGPRALAGTVDPAVLSKTDAEGCALKDALDAFGGNSSDLASLKRDPAHVRAYLEVHIEQGPVLEQRDIPVGVVSGICGIERNAVTFHGETGHAGTVPMDGRADALVAAADFIALVHDLAQAIPDLRATIGTCAISPNVPNGIPDTVELTLEIRAPSDDAREAFSARMAEIAADCADRRNVGVKMRQTYEQVAVPCDPEIVELFSDAAEKNGQTPLVLPSGATHDASAMSDLCPVGMLFVRCRGGVSHRPEEYASSSDMNAAINVLADTLAALEPAQVNT